MKGNRGRRDERAKLNGRIEETARRKGIHETEKLIVN
jgi:hypothetical protein